MAEARAAAAEHGAVDAVSVLETWLSALGLIGVAGTPVPSVHTLQTWVTIPWTPDTVFGSAPPFTYAVSSPRTDIAFVQQRFGGTVDVITPLTTNQLLRPDPSDATKFQINLSLRIVYPALPGSPDKLAGTGKLPVVLLNHGHHHSWDFSVDASGTSVTGIAVKPSYTGYAYLQDALAQHGIVSASVDHNFACATKSLIETRADTIIAALDVLFNEDAAATSRYSGRLDFTKIGLMGHSRGGDAVVRAVKKIGASVSLLFKYTVKAVCSLAPTDVTGGGVAANRMALAQDDLLCYQVVYGALDGDVIGDGFDSAFGTGFRHYDRAQCPKTMAFLDACCHNAFNTVWFADGNDSSDPRLASQTDHQKIAVDYIGDLFRWQLNGEKRAQTLDGRAPNSAGQHASQQWIFGQRVKKIDDFETAGTNLLGGARTLVSGSAPTTIETFGTQTIGSTPLEMHTAHQTQVLHCDVTTAPPATRVLATAIPAGSADWSAFDTLLVSLSGWFDPTSDATIAGANLPRLTITLSDTASASASVDWTVYGATLPSRPVFKTDGPNNLTLMRLETIPIALSSFSGVDLTKVGQVAFDVKSDNAAHVFVDNLHVVQRS